MCLWNTNAPQWQFPLRAMPTWNLWKIGQMLSSHRKIACSITVVTSIAMERFCDKESSPGTYD
jgi:hypothetical protein